MREGKVCAGPISYIIVVDAPRTQNLPLIEGFTGQTPTPPNRPKINSPQQRHEFQEISRFLQSMAQTEKSCNFFGISQALL